MGLLKKLRFEEGGAVCVINSPKNLRSNFESLTVHEKIGNKPVERILLFATSKKELNKDLKSILKFISPDALFWVAYPKKSGSIKSDITRDNGWGDLMQAGYDPVMQIAVNEDWSALRFRRTEAIGKKKRDTPMEQRQVEGIDFKNKVVTLPDDVRQEVDNHKGLADFFDSLSYSHKKEYVEHIVEAKRPETRQRRIDKTIIALKALKEKK